MSQSSCPPPGYGRIGSSSISLPACLTLAEAPARTSQGISGIAAASRCSSRSFCHLGSKALGDFAVDGAMLGVRSALLGGFRRKPRVLGTFTRSGPSSGSVGRGFDDGGAEDKQVEDFNAELEQVFGSRPETSPLGGAAGGKRRADEPLPRPALFLEENASSQLDILSGQGMLSHVDGAGKASMVNVVSKANSKRVAVASGRVLLSPEAFSLVDANEISKGDVLAVAKIAGIQGAKRTSSLIPLCHNILLSAVDVSLSLDPRLLAVDIRAQATASGPTGVEMEALMAVSVAALTVYDMCKSVSKGIQIANVQLESKMGGKSGDWVR